MFITLRRFNAKNQQNVASFKWNLKTLPFGTQSVNYHLNGDFFREKEPVEVMAASVEVCVTITRKSEVDYEMRLDCHGELTIPCDRCLEAMTHDVDTIYELSVRQEGDEFDDSRDRVLMVPEGWHELDVEPLIRVTVLLTVPIMHTHPDGECNQDMFSALHAHEAVAAENEEETAERQTDPRWEALRKLKNNN